MEKLTEKQANILAILKEEFEGSAFAEDVVEKIDDGAFLIVTSATEIFGEGYKKHGTYY